MQTLVLELTVLLAVVLSFMLAALVVVHYMRGPQARDTHGGSADVYDPSATIARVVAEIEQLAALRERGVLTDKEFVAQKAKVLRGGNA